MVALNQQEKQIVEQFRSLDPQRRRHVLLEMARANPGDWKRFQQQGEARLRELAKQKGLDWNRLDDQQRQDFIEEVADGEAA
jgi:hypothetical protein